VAHEFRIQRRVEFAATDMAGIVHFANYFRYMEACEHEFFRSLKLVLHRQEGGQMQGFARVKVDCQYRAPLKYGDLFEMHLTVVEKRSSSMTYQITFSHMPEDGGESRETARGTMTVVCVRGLPGIEPMRAVPIPDDIATRVVVAPKAPIEGVN
jgi:YbgC/YbaW family acyl-CoA thioester hydrolase